MDKVSPVEISHSGKLHDVILARTLKTTSNIREQDKDLRVFLKLRENRRRIHRIASDLWSEELEIAAELDDGEDYIENLQDIEMILNNMRIELAAL